MKLKVSKNPPYDPYQCFVRENHVSVTHTNMGDLDGLVFAAKDVFEVKGSRYSNGHPDWLASQKISTKTATAIEKLLDSGADLVGKTICDELCFSISGENWHYGSPIHPLDPMRYAGGSSSGSAIAVASGLVDFSIGSDCLGSVRVPASYNGLYAMRPTLKRVDNTGEAPYCESMDVLGWMAKDVNTFKRVSKVLLGDDKRNFSFKKILVLDGFIPNQNSVTLDDRDWVDTFRHVQGYEVYNNYKNWLKEYNPFINRGPKERLEWASTISKDIYEKAILRKIEIEHEIATLLSDDTVLVLPTASSVAVHRLANGEEITKIRNESSKLLCISPLSKTPQLTLPLHEKEGLPFGISFIGPVGSDLQLIDFAISIANQIKNSLF